MEVEVIYPYIPQEDDELELEVGDIVTNVEHLERGWCKGTVNNVSGAFPDNFVRAISNNKGVMLHEGTPNHAKNSTPNAAENARKIPVGRRMCRATFSYTPQHEDELGLKEGDVLTVLEEVEEGWFKGILNGVVGMFPSNFVEEMNEVGVSDTPPLKHPAPPMSNEVNGNSQPPKTDLPYKTDNETNGALSVIRHSSTSAFKPVNGAKESASAKESTDSTKKQNKNSVIPSRLAANGDPVGKSPKISVDKEAKRSIASPVDSKTKKILKSPQSGVNVTPKGGGKSANSAAIVSSPPQLPPKPVRELARVLYPYIAEHEDELELKEGDIVAVICKDLEDKGWWKGELDGRVGVFPDNFVQLIPSPVVPGEVAKPPRPEKTIPSRHSPPHSPVTSLAAVANGNFTAFTPINDKATHTPPPLPGKKMVPPPPPTEKKPSVSSVDGSPGAKTTPKSSRVPEDGSLSIGRETHLTHVTRPRGPSNRRPPSQILKEKKNSLDGDEEAAPSTNYISTSEVPLTLESHSALNMGLGDELPNGNTPPESVPSPLSEENGILGSPPTSDEGVKPPWLKELRENQKKKRLSGYLTVSADLDSTPPKLPSSPPPNQPYPQLIESVGTGTPSTCTEIPSLHSNSVGGKGTPSVSTEIPSPHSNSIGVKGTSPISIEKPSPQLNQSGVKPDPPSGAKPMLSAPIPYNREGFVEGSRTNFLTTQLRTKPVSANSVASQIRNSYLSNDLDSTDAETVFRANPGTISSGTTIDEKLDAIEKRFSAKIRLLEQKLEEQKTLHVRQLQLLTRDLDEERKDRACLQIEVDRLNKLVTSGFAQV